MALQLRLLAILAVLQFCIISSTNGGINPSMKTFQEKSEGFSYRAETKNVESPTRNLVCELSPELIAEIAAYKPIADRIIQEATVTSAGKTYSELAKFVDKFGHRLSGSQSLEDSIDYVMQKMENDGLVNVHGEEAVVPHWVRGEEKATLLTPRKKNLALLGLGNSVGTTVEGITADVWVVKSFAELRADPGRAMGKIIVYNQDFETYGATVQYRTKGASEAARVGGIASLIRSIAPFSLDTPHTGNQNYDPDVPHIPTACITSEDAELMHRLQESGEKLTIHLKMLDYNLPLTTSRNAIGEITGTEKPDESVIVSGHIDSWDVGQGAMDDGGGCFISTEALALLHRLNLTPRRTLRAIMWTSEEVGLWGGKDYARHHMADMSKIIAAFESDAGTFTPLGLDFAGTEEAGCIVIEVLKLLEALDATQFANHNSVSTDISHLISQGVPGFSLMNAADHYFWYHHTEADTMSMMDPIQLDKGTAVWAVAAYVIADLKDALPRRPPPTAKV